MQQLGTDKIEAVNVLIEANADIHQVDAFGRSPLDWAIIHNNDALIKILVAAGAHETEALLHAAKTGNGKLMQELIADGAMVNAVDKDGNTALLVAAKAHKKEVVQALIDAKANVHHANNDGWTALDFAAYQGYNDIVQVLIGAKANVHYSNKGDWTAVKLAASFDHDDVVKTLIDAGAAPIAPLHVAEKEKNVKQVQELHRAECA